MIYFSHRFCVTSRMVAAWFHAKSLIVSDLSLSVDMCGSWPAHEKRPRRATCEALEHL